MFGNPIEKEKTPLSSQDNGHRTKDGEYWIQGDFIIFEVENSLFRVPSYQFIRHSVVFADMLNLPQREQKKGGSREGSDDKNPIVLPETITANDFRNFLKALYPQMAFKDVSSGLSKEELISVLKLSTMWYFLEYRAEAIVKLPSFLTPAEMIAIGRQYKCFELMKDGIHKIVGRSGGITDEEAVLMEPMTAVALYRIREENCACSVKRKSEHVYTSTRDLITKYLDTDCELKSIKQEGLGYTVTHA